MAFNVYVMGDMAKNALTGNLNNLADSGTTIKCALLEVTWTPDQNNHEVFTASDWTASTTYSVGDYVVPTTANGHVYVATAGGDSGSGEPTWPTTDGETVTDNGVTWECVADGDLQYYEPSGTGYTAGGAEITNKSVLQASGTTTFDGDDVLWSSSSITARYGAIYDTGNNKLLAYVDLGSSRTSNSSDFALNWDTDGIFTLTVTQAS